MGTIGSYQNIGGVHEYPNMIRNSEKKPIRVYLQDGLNDNRGMRGRGENATYDAKWDWHGQNIKMAEALKEKGYDFNYTWGIGTHSDKQGGAIMRQSVKEAVEFVVRKVGRLDAVVNAAGVIKKMSSLERPAAEFERIVRINLVGNFIVAQAAGRVMKDQTPDRKGLRGAIVNIASLNSFVSLSEVLAYACSKS